ncbi:MAG: protein-L-isoaspartate O-methyltransferase, partial [Candidatus Korarchaeum sp.]|nr:protein-L-isoaspartate O-methyltransferase [Candidatus Korarchaeum sp.]MDW8035331.1 protein-L-isoaspartate O-methyltransferase [Candidatus Korarchaeum sp.]
MDPHYRLIERLVRMGIIKTEKVRRSAEIVRRELFVPEKYRKMAYEDIPLPIGEDQTISAPHMVFMMNELLDLDTGQLVLEVGSGSGYHAATIAEIVAPSDAPVSKWGTVITIEINPKLAILAYNNLRAAGYSSRVYVVNSDGSSGLPLRDKVDRVLVTAAAPRIPPPLIELLKEGGRMVIPVGSPGFWGQDLLVVE